MPQPQASPGDGAAWLLSMLTQEGACQEPAPRLLSLHQHVSLRARVKIVGYMDSGLAWV